MAILPINSEDFDILEWYHTDHIFLALEFKRPNQGEIYWRIPGLYSNIDMQMMLSKLQPYFENLSTLQNALAHQEQENLRREEELQDPMMNQAMCKIKLMKNIQKRVTSNKITKKHYIEGKL